jgi:hypothetical protein
MSKKKRWTLVKVIEKSSAVDVAAMRAARRLEEARKAEVAASSGSDKMQPAESAAEEEPAAETPAAE